MRRIMCKSKIHRATVTEAELYYEGSLTLDTALMDAADMLAYEKVQVVNVNNDSKHI
jgi:aspartate 1-decarboxylase